MLPTNLVESNRVKMKDLPGSAALLPFKDACHLLDSLALRIHDKDDHNDKENDGQDDHDNEYRGHDDYVLQGCLPLVGLAHPEA